MLPAVVLRLRTTTLVGPGILLIALSMSSCGSRTSNPSQTNPVPTLVSIAPATATAGQASFTLSLSGSGYVAGSTVLWNGSARPTSFDSSNQLTAQISASDVAAPEIARVSVSNPAPGGGASNIFRFGIGSGIAVQRFLYVSNFATNTISSYSIDPKSGALSPVPGSPFAAASTNSNPGPIIMDRFGQFLYVRNFSNIGCKSCTSLSGFSSDGSGTLVPLTGSPFSNFIPFAFVEDPTGNIIYGSTGSDIVTMFIDAESGTLMQLADSPGFAPFLSMAENPAGTFLYAAAAAQGSSSTVGVWVGSISPTTGVVTTVAGSPFAGTGTSAVTVDPLGRFVFAVKPDLGDGAGSELLSFTIDATTGALRLLNSTTYGFPAFLGDVLVHPSAKFLYVTREGDNTIMVFAIDAAGNLTPVAGSPFSAGVGAINPNFMATDPEGKFLYVANYTGGAAPATVSGFTVDASSGALTPVAGSPYPTGGAPDSIVIGPQ
jgi:6-phosphogluconolactonase